MSAAARPTAAAALAWSALATAVLGYSGSALPAAIPPALAVAAVAIAPGAGAGGGARRSFLALLVLLYLVAVAATFVHPSATGAAVVESLAASCAVGLALAAMPVVPAALALMVLASAASAVLLALAFLSDPALAASKDPLFDVLSRAIGLHGPALPGAHFLHANVAGALAGVAAAAELVAGFASAPGRGRRAWLAIGAATALVAAASGSRSAIGALAAGLLVSLVVRSRRRAWALALAIGAAAAAAAVAAPVLGADAASRLDTWAGTWQAIAGDPLIGRGPGSFPLVYAAQPGSAGAVGPHDTLLFLWLDFGVLAPLLALGLTALAAAALVRTRGPLALALLAALAAWFVNSISESTILVSWPSLGFHHPGEEWHEVVLPLAFALWGLAIAARGTRSATETASAPDSTASAIRASGSP